MIKVGLTGGIGCGKTTIARVFSILDTPVYSADLQAKKISALPKVENLILKTFGSSILSKHSLHIDRQKLAQKVFSDTEQLSLLNNIIHPLLFQDFLNWVENIKRTQPKINYCIIEAAILFESHLDNIVDYVIDVEAPVELRIKRCIRRDHSSASIIQARIQQQMSCEERIKKSNYILYNDEEHPILSSILALDQQFKTILPI
ncbi:MAG: dephospho-CoA kinase [Bacteroidales bacterium]